jgi:valyl-tRNA synthetase
MELPKTYDSKSAESKWYEIWEKGSYFKPKKGKAGKPFSIIMPPPNVTGQLHMGHALDITTQDALIRFKRMKGFETLFLPGMDHAGISTQVVVEKKVKQEEGKSRHDFTREEFLEKIWQWKKEYGGIIIKQQKAMGASPDWDYFMFTMDKEANEAVNKVFVSLYNEGLIYQDDRLVNWDTVLQSAISDAEVEYKEVKGKFYHIFYKVKDSDIKLEIATTRPETLLGDTAIAVNPNDERWNSLIGKKAIVPICNREVPIIGDEYVDMEKGTGCLKVTPGHDFNDFEIGKRHKLETINILNLDGSLNEYGLEWANKSTKETRKGVLKKLEELEQLGDIKDHIHQVGHGDRSKTVIEPILSKQWFLNVHDMAERAVNAVEKDETKFYPKGWENTYFSWLREPKDWCLSRQLWWGHQIPVFTCKSCNKQWASEQHPSSCPDCSHQEIAQDPDVLDTWFSSGLWPFSTLGWPDPERMSERKFDTFYSTSVLVTGFDIIFFWVARMMMMGLKNLDKVPFEKVYIHAIVRDKEGRKMSKSLGNGIDPLDMIEHYGADALRYTLAAGSGYNRNLNLDSERIAGYRNFINKIWNAFRFIQPFLNDADPKLPDQLNHHERWILSELNMVTKQVNESMEEFRFDDSCSQIYGFVYDKFCSWFIEVSKNILHGDDQDLKIQRASVLKFSFKKVLALLHPFAPYITEELWSYLKDPSEDLLIVQDFPEYDSSLDFKQDQDLMNNFIEVITAVRNLRANVNIGPKEPLAIEVFTDHNELKQYLNDETEALKDIGRLKEITVKTKGLDRPKKSVMSVTSFTEVFLPLEGVIDLNDQIGRLEKSLQKTEKEYSKYANKLKNEKFMKNAPDEVVNEVKQNAAELSEKLKAIRENLDIFKS